MKNGDERTSVECVIVFFCLFGTFESITVYNAANLRPFPSTSWGKRSFNFQKLFKAINRPLVLQWVGRVRIQPSKLLTLR